MGLIDQASNLAALMLAAWNSGGYDLGVSRQDFALAVLAYLSPRRS